MTVPRYGVLRGKPLAGKLGGRPGKKPHYQIHVEAAGVQHRIAVNVVSDQSPSELLFLLDDDFRHPALSKVATAAEGYTPIPSRPGGLALDFVRDSLFRPEQMRALPFDVPGPDNDLAEIFGLHVRRAIERGADVFAFGSKWGPEPDKADEQFGFLPGNGIHDIHMNQGSPPPHKGDNGVWQDGALFVHFPAEGRWLAFFLAFQSQFAQTDDSGNAIPGSPLFGQSVAPVAMPAGQPPVPPEAAVGAVAAGGVRIVAALVNPAGPDQGHESVTVLNAGPEAVPLAGWSIANGVGGSFAVDGVVVAAGEAARIAITDPRVALSNQGGTINLFDAEGRKVDGVAYTKEQASAQGWSITF